MRPLYFDFSLTDEFVQSATQANDPAVIHQFMFGMLSANICQSTDPTS